LNELRRESREKLAEIDKQLASAGGKSDHGLLPDSPGSTEGQRAGAGPAAGEDASAESPPAGKATLSPDEHIRSLFRAYFQLSRQYEELVPVGREIKKHVEQLRSQPEYAAVLNEPDAKELWERGQKCERDKHLCCAYWIYKQASKLSPAPSAALAGRRFEQLASDPEVVASARICLEVQECHKEYLLATMLLKANPDRAKPHFAAVVARAPKDSEVYHAAAEQLKQLQ
jgi:hypothetical protein